MANKVLYKSSVWLNKENTHFTGNMTCCTCIDDSTNEKWSAITINDCYHTIRLHSDIENNFQDYLDKVDLMISELTKFRNHLKEYEVLKSDDDYIIITRDKDSIKISTQTFVDYISLKDFLEFENETIMQEFYNVRLKNLNIIDKDKIVKLIKKAIDKWK